MPLLYDKSNIADVLRGLASAHADGQPEVLDDRARRDGLVYNRALDAVGLVLGVGDWREENRDEQRA